MDSIKYLDADIVIIGGGPAGLSAALQAVETGIDNVLILERDRCLGGILNQCIHNGFGLHTFKEELTGPEYAKRYEDMVVAKGIPYKTDTFVLSVESSTADNKSIKIVTAMNKQDGLFKIRTKAVILSMGCRERPRGALNIPGYRPAGIYSAGTAQRLVNIEGFMPGKEVVILGSGDIGLIMARRMTLEGAKVKVVAELMPYSGGLKRNIVQCLDDYGIPLKLSHTVVDIKGKDRVEGVTIAMVDSELKPVKGTEEFYECDTLLLSCGLLPENELSMELGVSIDPVTGGPIVNESLETNISGVFACGNVLHVHDLVDFVSEEAKHAGENAAKYVLNYSGNEEKDSTQISDISLTATNGIRYTVPRTLNVSRMNDELKVRFRAGSVYKNSFISVYINDERIIHKKKMVISPGEMEEIILKKSELKKYSKINNITFKIEDN